MNSPRLPVLANVKAAYRLLWQHKALHARAVWPPIILLVAAELLYHRLIGNAHGLAQIEKTLQDAPWYWPVAAGLLWLAGIKFLLSFSISWRRHVMLGERFDPFYFRKPFWRYLAFLAWMYIRFAAAIIAAYSVARYFFGQQMAVCTFVYKMHFQAKFCTPVFEAAALVVAVIIFTWIFSVIIRVPVFTAIALDSPTSQRLLRRRMLGQFGFYVLIWILVMLPVFALTTLLGIANRMLEVDMTIVPIALAESAFRQACLFIHVSLGASVGMLTYGWVTQEQMMAEPAES